MAGYGQFPVSDIGADGESKSMHLKQNEFKAQNGLAGIDCYQRIICILKDLKTR